MAKISNLTTELDKYWPSLYCSTPSLCSGGHGSLWAHEMSLKSFAPLIRISEKHGTCSYPIIQDEYSYFSTALNLYSTYNVTAMLASDISISTDDGGKYPATDVVAAIKSSFGASPLLLCDGESLQELRLCFDKDLKPLDCKYGGRGVENDEVEYRRSCPRYISLPAYKPRGGGDTSGAATTMVANKLLAFIVAF
ncbi:hypothetical protein EJB05_42333 [Eragrostis curvula]|nr:hypothetical protein EJB05_42333 [Eragrostis curvula]